jgi:hypothetical protein
MEPCACDDYYGFNGGDDPQRAIKIAEKLDGKRQESQKGLGSDCDDSASERNHGGDQDGQQAADSKPDGHFWKRSEYLKCNRGVPMKDLDMSRFKGPTWQRAAEVGKL